MLARGTQILVLIVLGSKNIGINYSFILKLLVTGLQKLHGDSLFYITSYITHACIVTK